MLHNATQRTHSYMKGDSNMSPLLTLPAIDGVEFGALHKQAVY